MSPDDLMHGHHDERRANSVTLEKTCVKAWLVACEEDVWCLFQDKGIALVERKAGQCIWTGRC